MTADEIERREIGILLKESPNELAAEATFISDFLNNPMGDGVAYEPVSPEEIGALTSAPIISDGTDVYGYMDYQVHSFLEELVLGNTIEWTKA